MVCSLAYNDANQLLTETYSSGPLSALSVTNGYDQFLRRTNLSALNGSALLSRSVYSYDVASRLQTVSDGTNTAGYAYLANSPLVSQISFTNNGVQRMVTTKSYDNLNRLTAIETLNSQPSTINSFRYAYNSANQRTSITNVDNSRWVYTYDSLGQVTSGKKYWSDGTPVAGQQFEYTFDDIGNRKTTAAGGDQYCANLRSAGYTNNSLNQTTSRGVPGYVNILGEATNTATVTLWSSSGSYAATSRKSNYFRGELLETNTSAALWLTITNLAVLNSGTNADIVASTVGNLFVPQTPETFSYDADGNVTNNGRLTLAWDAENRLTNLTSLSTLPTAAKKKVDCAYDWQGRRIQKIVSTNNGSAYVAASTNRFVYDGWNLVAVLNSTNGLVYSFTWGTDLSGTMQGAGGVGGLVSLTVYNGTNAGTYFYAYDGNGNVAALVNATNGAIAAQYEYGPFGEVLRATGPMDKANPFRFSTKYQDDETDLLYYGYRYYNASTGRWLSRDPIEERGGLNLYGMIVNDLIDRVDFLGLTYGTISVVTFDSFNGFYTSGLHVRFRWAPPSDHKCCKCSKAVWVQDKSIILNKGIWGIYTTPWQKDWDETGYMYPQQQSDLWTCGGLLKNMDMWDDPSVSGIAGYNLLEYVFRADSRVKCLEGEDKGKIYGGVFWGFDISTFGASKWLSKVGPMVW